MNKPFKNILIVIAVVILGAVFYFASKKSTQTTSMEKTSESMVKKETTKKEDVAMMEKTTASSRYLPYSSDVLDSSVTKRRVLFFYATWCPTCKIANDSFNTQGSLIPDDVVVVRVNYNDPETNQEEKALAKKYGITYQHTFVQIDSRGNEIVKWNGGEIDKLVATIK